MGIRGWGWPLGIANPLSNWPIPISLYKSLIHFKKKMAAIFKKLSKKNFFKLNYKSKYPISITNFEIFRCNYVNSYRQSPMSPVLSQSPNFLIKIYLILYNLSVFLFNKILIFSFNFTFKSSI